MKGKRLIGEIARRHEGRAILVMGGAPCLPSDLERIPSSYDLGCAISANEHGAMLRKIDYVVSVDENHQRIGRRMEVLMRKLGAPIISQCFYADYRIPDWNYWGNSGMNAIYVAWILGGHPIIVAGIENYAGHTYFHDADAKSSGRHKGPEYFIDRLNQLNELTSGAAIRPVSGPLTERWPVFNSDERFKPYASDPRREKIIDTVTRAYSVRRNFSLGKSIIRKGEVVGLTDDEHQRFKDRTTLIT